MTIMDYVKEKSVYLLLRKGQTKFVTAIKFDFSLLTSRIFRISFVISYERCFKYGFSKRLSRLISYQYQHDYHGLRKRKKCVFAFAEGAKKIEFCHRQKGVFFVTDKWDFFAFLSSSLVNAANSRNYCTSPFTFMNQVPDEFKGTVHEKE